MTCRHGRSKAAYALKCIITCGRLATRMRTLHVRLQAALVSVAVSMEAAFSEPGVGLSQIVDGFIHEVITGHHHKQMAVPPFLMVAAVTSGRGTA